MLAFRIIANLSPAYAEFQDNEEFSEYMAARPDLRAVRRKGDNPNHIYCKLYWRIWPRKKVGQKQQAVVPGDHLRIGQAGDVSTLMAVALTIICGALILCLYFLFISV